MGVELLGHAQPRAPIRLIAPDFVHQPRHIMDEGGALFEKHVTALRGHVGNGFERHGLAQMAETGHKKTGVRIGSHPDLAIAHIRHVVLVGGAPRMVLGVGVQVLDITMEGDHLVADARFRGVGLGTIGKLATRTE